MSVQTKRHHVKKVDRLGNRQPRPPRRRQGTRVGIIRAAVKEG
jgi:hypothetical protein